MPDQSQGIRLLVIDYDGCALANYPGRRSDSLSPKLIEHAKNGDYTAFYGCTHRCYSIETIYVPIYIPIRQMLIKGEPINENITTSKITENFQLATGLSCMGVSTLDDNLYPKCGAAYENMLKPYEATGQLATTEMRYVSLMKMPYYYQSKNAQLTQIAQHARQVYPDVPITIDYIDDHKFLCWKATKVTAEKNWPVDVKIKVFHHYAINDHAEIVPIHENEQNQDTNSTYSAASICKKIGLFSAAVVCASVAIGTAVYANSSPNLKL